MASRSSVFYRPGTYQPEDSATWLMRRITVAFAQEVGQRLEPDGLTHAQWIPLLKIHQGVATTAAELARETHVDAATMTRTVSASGMDWGVLAAAGVLTIIPGALVIYFVRNYIAKGFALGRV